MWVAIFVLYFCMLLLPFLFYTPVCSSYSFSLCWKEEKEKVGLKSPLVINIYYSWHISNELKTTSHNLMFFDWLVRFCPGPIPFWRGFLLNAIWNVLLYRNCSPTMATLKKMIIWILISFHRIYINKIFFWAIILKD